MTTAHRPTFDPAKGKDSLSGPVYHQRLQAAHTTLKYRQPGQDGKNESSARDLRSELLKAEAEYRASKNKSGPSDPVAVDETGSTTAGVKRLLPSDGPNEAEAGEDADEDAEVKRRRKVLLEAAEIDADFESSSSGSEDGSSDSGSESDEDEDETAALMRELAKIKKKRAEEAAQEEAKKAAAEEDARVREIARGNPLLGGPSSSDFSVKRRWDDDVVFRNQARGADDKNKPKEFVNDMLRSDFHKRFMSKYVQ